MRKNDAPARLNTPKPDHQVDGEADASAPGADTATGNTASVDCDDTAVGDTVCDDGCDDCDSSRLGNKTDAATPLKPPAVSRTREEFLCARSLLREHRDCRRASRGPVSTAELAKATQILRRILGATPGKSTLR